MRLPPKKAFPHSILVRTGKIIDTWGKTTFEKEIVLPNVRFDEDYNFNRASLDASVDMPSSLIVVFKKYNLELDEIKPEDKVVWEDKEFVVLKTVPLYFDSDEVLGYELEVK